MPSRKAFLTEAALATAALSAGGAMRPQRADAGPDPTPTPSAAAGKTPPPVKQPGPAPLALALAASLQRDLPAARLSKRLTEKIASDINDNLAINKAFRNRKQRDLPPPDFIFNAQDDQA